MKAAEFVMRPFDLLPVNDFFQIRIEQFPKLGMAFYQAGNIAKVFELFTLPSFRIPPGLDFSTQCIFQRGHSHQYPMDVRRNRPAGKISIKIFRTQLNAYLRATAKIDRPWKTR